MPYRLNHLNRNELVETAVKVTIVLQQQRNLVLETGFSDGLLRIFKLLLRDCSRRHMAAIALCGMNRETAPSRTDLHH